MKTPCADLIRERIKEMRLSEVECTEIYLYLEYILPQIESIESQSVENMSSAIHEIWAKWYIHQRDNSTQENIERWNRQSTTPYEMLSEEEKEKDRKQIRIIMESTPRATEET